MYFNMFPQIAYDIKGDGEVKAVTNILKRLAIRNELLNDYTIFDRYDVEEGETPESIADLVYGDVNLHWIVCYTNNIVDRYHDWPLTEGQLMQFDDDKYDNPNGVHHYEISQTSGDTDVKINIGTDKTDYPSATTITNYEYEVERQDGISEVSILEAESLQQFVKEFEAIIREK